jgi:X-X-X-Leu-X-X-Gly heptad repeat protein
MKYQPILLFQVTSALSTGQLVPADSTASSWEALVNRYSLGSPAAWETLSTVDGRRQLETAVDWRSLAASTGRYSTGSGQYSTGSGQYAPLVGSVQNGRTLLEGTYYMVDNNNFDRYLEELGVDLLLRQLAVIANPTVTISRYNPVKI